MVEHGKASREILLSEIQSQWESKLNNPRIDDDKISELIESRVAAEDADGSWMVALLLMRIIPTQKEIAANLKHLVSAVAEHDLQGSSLSERLNKICGVLAAIEEKAGPR